MVNDVDVLDAQRTVLSAETQLVLTERARLTEMVSLFKALGGGWQPAIGPGRRHVHAMPDVRTRDHGTTHGRGEESVVVSKVL